MYGMLKKWSVITGFTLVGTLFLIAIAVPVSAERMTSPNYVLNGNTGSTFGGQGNSTNYGMFSTGGEAVVGSGASGSYILKSDDSADSAMSLTVQPSGLQAYYKLDEGSGVTAVDSGAYGRHGTIVNADWVASGGGKMGGAISSDSEHARVVAPNPVPSGDKFTISMWIKRTWLDGNKAFASTWNYDGNGEGWAVQSANPDATKLRVFVAAAMGDGGDNYIDSNASGVIPVDSIWRQVSVVYDGALSNANRVKMYVNGSFVSGTVVGTFPTTLVNNSTNLVLGNFLGLGRPSGGGIDHVKVFNRALTNGEISAEYSAQNAGIETGLTLGSVTPGTSNSLFQDIIVRTASDKYSISLSQDHDLQKGAVTIPSIGGSIAAPSAWSEGSTKGLGFTLVNAPGLDGKWNSGLNYAAIPSVSTGFYSRAGHGVADTIDVLSSRLRLDTQPSQEMGGYSNAVTYTGVTIP